MSTVGATEEAAPFSFVLVLQGPVWGVGARSGWGGGGYCKAFATLSHNFIKAALHFLFFPAQFCEPSHFFAKIAISLPDGQCGH